MSLFVLDTDILTLFEREHATVAAHIAEHSPAEIAISIVTVEEQLSGCATPPGKGAGKARLGISAARCHGAIPEARADLGH